MPETIAYFLILLVVFVLALGYYISEARLARKRIYNLEDRIFLIKKELVKILKNSNLENDDDINLYISEYCEDYQLKNSTNEKALLQKITTKSKQLKEIPRLRNLIAKLTKKNIDDQSLRFLEVDLADRDFRYLNNEEVGLILASVQSKK